MQRTLCIQYKCRNYAIIGHIGYTLRYSIRGKRCRSARHFRTWIPLASRGARPEHVQSSRCGAFWEPPGGFLVAAWGLPGASWGFLGLLVGLLGASWVPLGASWGLSGPRARNVRSGPSSGPSLGAVLGTSWAVLEASWAVLGHLEAIFGRLGCTLGRLGDILRPSGALLGR